MNFGQLVFVLMLIKLRSGSVVSTWTFKCPCECDFDDVGRKRVTCTGGSLRDVPIRDIDTKTQVSQINVKMGNIIDLFFLQVLIITGSLQKPNDLAIGRIFLEFELLEEIIIRHSQVPLIGDSTFWPGKKIRLIDLSYNRIEVLKESDFNGLTDLSVLNLSNNLISTIPSAVFHQLPNLTKLSLAQNKIGSLVPRLFYKLSKLERLELSGNPLEVIEPDDVKELKSLKVLQASKCGLKKIHSLVYENLKELEVIGLISL